MKWAHIDTAGTTEVCFLFVFLFNSGRKQKKNNQALSLTPTLSTTTADPALPHTDFPKKERAHVKPPSLSYFINFAYLYRPGGLMVTTLALIKGFSRVLVSHVFDSWCMYIFWWALTLLFYEFLVTFYFLLVFFFPYVLLQFLLDIKSSGLIKIALISH